MVYPETCMRGFSLLLLGLIALGGVAHAPARVAADTVEMKGGGKIENCRVLEQKSGSMQLRTPSGPMTVPLAAVERVVHARSVFDEYDDARAKVRDKDVAGLFKLAGWCHETGGLRPEAGELLEKVIELEPNHAEARHRLRYVFVNDSWRRARPVVLHLVVTDGEALAASFSQQLSVVLQARGDARLTRKKRAKEAVSSCVLEVSLGSQTTKETIFQGRQIRGAMVQAVVTLAAKSEWAGNKPLTLRLEGEVPAAAGDAQLALMDAFTRNSHQVHRFIDRITQRRMVALEARVRERQKESKKGGK